MATLDFAVVALALVAYSLVSGRLHATVLTAPILFVAFGFAVGQHGIGLVRLDFEESLLHIVAEITLALVLFTDAARIDLVALRKNAQIPVRLLLIGMPLTILSGAALAHWLIPGFGWWEAALLATILTPTDAALGHAVVSSPKVPARIRQALNVESGLNDGIALPLVVLFLCLTNMEHALDDGTPWLLFGFLQITLGPIVGLAIGLAGGRLVEVAARSGWITEAFQGVAALGIALLAFAGSELIGGNGFIAAFVAGLTLGNLVRSVSKFLLEFAEAEGQLLTLLVFMVFGAALVPEALAHFDWRVALFACLALSVMRMVPVGLSLIGLGLKVPTVLFLAWFGPRGLASILFALLVLAEPGIAAGEEILLATIVTVLFSVLAHGLTAAPAAAAYGRLVPEICPRGSPEHHEVHELPTRLPAMADSDAVRSDR